MEFPELARAYNLPVPTVDQARREVVVPSPARVISDRVRSAIRRRVRGGRLAYLDNTFPWKRSGFRYHEAEAIHELLPDTLFFSMWELDDPFPAPVHRLTDFPVIARGAGVTDAYGVFQLFLEGIAGMHPSGDGPPHSFEGPDLSGFLAETGIRLHGSIYPGGGFLPTPEGLERLNWLAGRMGQVFSYTPEVLDNVPGVTEVAQAFTRTDLYPYSDSRWEQRGPLVCLFAADAPPRKGLEVVLAAFAELDPEQFHLHVVGPHQHRRDALPSELATFHGWLDPEELRDLHRRAHVFVSPVSAEAAGPPGTFLGVTDGFPTQAAADAMSGGCLLVSANPASDHRVLTPEVDYLERPAHSEAVRATLRQVARDPGAARAVADAGAATVRDRMEIRRATAIKLAHMGLLDPPG